MDPIVSSINLFPTHQLYVNQWSIYIEPSNSCNLLTIVIDKRNHDDDSQQSQLL